MRRSTIIACIAAAVVLSGGIAALTMWPEPEPELQETPPPPPDMAMELVNEPLDDIASIQFTPLDGAPFTLRRDPESGDFTLDAADMVFQGHISTMRTVYNAATSLTNLTIVTEAADDEQLAMFGFDAPVMTWRIDRTDGTSVELMVGVVQVAGRGRYIRIADSREVFLLSERQSTLLTHTLEDFYDLAFFPPEIFTGADSIMQIFEHILLETNEHVLELRRRSDEEIIEAGLGTSVYQMLQPAVGDCNDFLVQTNILENIASITPDSVETARPADLSAYGLDSPDRLTLTSENWSATLLIGNHNVDRGGRYIMFEGYDAVLFDPNGNYSFLNVAPSHLRARLMWLHNIGDVSSVDFELEGVTRLLEFEHDSDDQSLSAWLDGAEIGETNARRLYIGVLNIAQNDETNAPIPNTPPVYSVTINFLDGGSETLDLYRLSDTQFLIVHDGENTGFFITRMSLQQNLLNRFDLLDRGEDLPAS